MNSWFSMSDVGSSMMRLCLCPRASVKLALILPPALEPGRRQFGISDCVLNVLLPQVSLQLPRIPPRVRLVKTASMTEHVRVRLDLEPSSLASPADELLEVADGHRRPAPDHEKD